MSDTVPVSMYREAMEVIASMWGMVECEPSGAEWAEEEGRKAEK